MFGNKKSLAKKVVRPEVVAGIELLDEMGPADWRDTIDVKRLNIELADRCVLGQLYGSYLGGLRALGFCGLGTMNSSAYGFSTNISADYPRLNREWKLALSA